MSKKISLANALHIDADKYWLKTVTALNRKRVKERSANPFYSNDEKIRLLMDWRENGNVKSRDELLAACYPIVIKEVNKYVNKHGNHGLDINDFHSEGNLALLDALENYDPSVGTTFLSYIKVYLPKYIFPFMKAHGSTIRKPDTQIKQITQELRLFNRFVREKGREPINGEVYNYKMDGEYKTITFGNIRVNRVISGNSSVNKEDEDGDELFDTMSLTDSSFDEDTLEYIRNVVNKTWMITNPVTKKKKTLSLTKREKDILHHKFELNSDIPDIIYSLRPQTRMEKLKYDQSATNIVKIVDEYDNEIEIKFYCSKLYFNNKNKEYINSDLFFDFSHPHITNYVKYENQLFHFKSKNKIKYLYLNGTAIVTENVGNQYYVDLNLKMGKCITPQGLYMQYKNAIEKLRKIIIKTKEHYV